MAVQGLIRLIELFLGGVGGLAVHLLIGSVPTRVA
jgi:hypothetical protein